MILFPRPFCLRQKLIALMVSVCMLLTDTYGSMPLAHSEVPEPAHQAPSLQIPEALASVENVWKGTNGKTLFYIQDAHDSLEAQENIAKVIHLLVDHHQVQTVFEEGYEGAVPTDNYFAQFANSEVKEKISFYLLDKLRIGGAEYAHINRKKDFSLIGADNVELHLKNMQWFEEAALNRSGIEQELKELEQSFMKLAHQSFSSELKNWMRLRQRFESHEVSFLDYLHRLRGLDASAEGLSELPTLHRLLNQPSADWIGRMDAKTLFSELDAWEAKITGRWTKAAETKRILEFLRQMTLLKRLISIELSQAEFEIAKKIVSNFKTKEAAEFLFQKTGESLVLSKRWETQIQAGVQFYETALLRDRAVEQRLVEFRNTPDATNAVLVFGGFHKENIIKIAIEQGFNCWVITPRMSSLDSRHQEYYRHLMSGNLHPFEIPFNAARANRVENAMLMDQTGKVELLPMMKFLDQLSQNRGIISLPRQEFVSALDLEVKQWAGSGRLFPLLEQDGASRNPSRSESRSDDEERNAFESHFRMGLNVRFFNKAFLFGPKEYYELRPYESKPKIRQPGDEFWTLHQERKSKINKALEFLRQNGLEGNADFFDRFITVIELENIKTHFLYQEVGRGVYAPVHAGRRRMILYISPVFLDALQPDNADDMAVLAAQINRGIRFLQTFKKLTEERAEPGVIHEQLQREMRLLSSSIEKQLFSEGLLKQKLLRFAERDRAIRQQIMKDIKQEIEAAIKEQRRLHEEWGEWAEQRDTVEFREAYFDLADKFAVIAHHFESVGNYPRADEYFETYVDTLRLVQRFEPGLWPVQGQQQIMLLFLRRGKYADFERELNVLIRNLPYPGDELRDPELLESEKITREAAVYMSYGEFKKEVLYFLSSHESMAGEHVRSEIEALHIKVKELFREYEAANPGVMNQYESGDSARSESRSPEDADPSIGTWLQLMIRDIQERGLVGAWRTWRSDMAKMHWDRRLDEADQTIQSVNVYTGTWYIDYFKSHPELEKEVLTNHLEYLGHAKVILSRVPLDALTEEQKERKKSLSDRERNYRGFVLERLEVLESHKEARQSRREAIRQSPRRIPIYPEEVHQRRLERRKWLHQLDMATRNELVDFFGKNRQFEELPLDESLNHFQSFVFDSVINPQMKSHVLSFQTTDGKSFLIEVVEGTPSWWEFMFNRLKGLLFEMFQMIGQLFTGNWQKLLQTSLNFSSSAFFMVLQLQPPAVFVRYGFMGETQQVVYSPNRGKLYATFWLWPVALWGSGWAVLALASAAIGASLWVFSRYFYKAEGHELTHVYQYLLVERIYHQLNLDLSVQAFHEMLADINLELPLAGHEYDADAVFYAPKGVLVRKPPNEFILYSVKRQIFSSIQKKIMDGDFDDIPIRSESRNTLIDEPLDVPPSAVLSIEEGLAQAIIWLERTTASKGFSEPVRIVLDGELEDRLKIASRLDALIRLELPELRRFSFTPLEKLSPGIIPDLTISMREDTAAQTTADLIVDPEKTMVFNLSDVDQLQIESAATAIPAEHDFYYRGMHLSPAVVDRLLTRQRGLRLSRSGFGGIYASSRPEFAAYFGLDLEEERIPEGERAYIFSLAADRSYWETDDDTEDDISVYSQKSIPHEDIEEVWEMGNEGYQKIWQAGQSVLRSESRQDDEIMSRLEIMVWQFLGAYEAQRDAMKVAAQAAQPVLTAPLREDIQQRLKTLKEALDQFRRSDAYGKYPDYLHPIADVFAGVLTPLFFFIQIVDDGDGVPELSEMLNDLDQQVRALRWIMARGLLKNIADYHLPGARFAIPVEEKVSFQGEFAAKLQKPRRVTIPETWKKQMAGNSVILRFRFDVPQRTIEVIPGTLRDPAMEKKIREEGPADPELWINYYPFISEAAMDQTGRITLPKSLSSLLNLAEGDRVLLTGKDDHFIIAARSESRSWTDSARETLRRYGLPLLGGMGTGLFVNWIGTFPSTAQSIAASLIASFVAAYFIFRAGTVPAKTFVEDTEKKQTRKPSEDPFLEKLYKKAKHIEGLGEEVRQKGRIFRSFLQEWREKDELPHGMIRVLAEYLKVLKALDDEELDVNNPIFPEDILTYLEWRENYHRLYGGQLLQVLKVLESLLDHGVIDSSRDVLDRQKILDWYGHFQTLGGRLRSLRRRAEVMLDHQNYFAQPESSNAWKDFALLTKTNHFNYGPSYIRVGKTYFYENGSHLWDLSMAEDDPSSAISLFDFMHHIDGDLRFRYGPHTLFSVLWMEQNSFQIRNQPFIDLGAGAGVLSAYAAHDFHPSVVISVEQDLHNNRLSQTFEANGIESFNAFDPQSASDPERSVLLAHSSFEQFFEHLFSEKGKALLSRLSGTRPVFMSNLPFSDTEKLIREVIAPAFRNRELDFEPTFIFAGGETDDESDAVREKVQRRWDALLDENGFQRVQGWMFTDGRDPMYSLAVEAVLKPVSSNRSETRLLVSDLLSVEDEQYERLIKEVWEPIRDDHLKMEEFLKKLRSLTDQYGLLFAFPEEELENLLNESDFGKSGDLYSAELKYRLGYMTLNAEAGYEMQEFFRFNLVFLVAMSRLNVQANQLGDRSTNLRHVENMFESNRGIMSELLSLRGGSEEGRRIKLDALASIVRAVIIRGLDLALNDPDRDNLFDEMEHLLLNVSREDRIRFQDISHYYHPDDLNALVILNPSRESIATKEFMNAPRQFIESQQAVEVQSFLYGQEGQIGQISKLGFSRPILPGWVSSKVYTWHSPEGRKVFAKRVNPLWVRHVLEEVQTARKVHKAFQEADPRLHAQEFIGLVYEDGLFYLLSEGAEGLSILGNEEEEKSPTVALIQRILREHGVADPEGPVRYKEILKQPDGDYTVVDFESLPINRSESREDIRVAYVNLENQSEEENRDLLKRIKWINRYSGWDFSEQNLDIDFYIRSKKYDGILFKAEEPSSGKMIGYAWLDLNDGKIPNLYLSAVLKSHHHRDIGSSLFREVLSYLDGQGFRQLELEIDSENAASISFLKEKIRTEGLILLEEKRDPRLHPKAIRYTLAWEPNRSESRDVPLIEMYEQLMDRVIRKGERVMFVGQDADKAAHKVPRAFAAPADLASFPDMVSWGIHNLIVQLTTEEWQAYGEELAGKIMQANFEGRVFLNIETIDFDQLTHRYSREWDALTQRFRFAALAGRKEVRFFTHETRPADRRLPEDFHGVEIEVHNIDQGMHLPELKPQLQHQLQLQTALRSESRSQTLEVESRHPVYFWLKGIGVEPEKAKLFDVTQNFSVIPIENADILERLKKTLPRAEPEWNLFSEKMQAWVLVDQNVPFGVMLEDQQHFYYLNFDLDTGPDRSHWIRHFERWEQFKSAALPSWGEKILGQPIHPDQIHSTSLRVLNHWTDVEPVKGVSFELPVFTGVFGPKNPWVDTLLEAAVREIEKAPEEGRSIERILVLGGGAGPEAVALAKKFDEVQIDVIDFPWETANAQASAAWHGLESRIHAFASNAFDQVTDRYDMILFSSPVPSFTESERDDLATSDPKGRTLRRVLKGLKDHLNPRGALYLMSLEDPRSWVLPEDQEILMIDDWYQDAEGGITIYKVSIDDEYLRSRQLGFNDLSRSESRNTTTAAESRAILDLPEIPAMVYVDYRDLMSSFSNAQREELFMAAYRHPEKLRLIIYGADLTDERLKPFKDLAFQKKNIRILDDEAASAYEKTQRDFIRGFRQAARIHLSKRPVRITEKFDAALLDEIDFFRYQENEDENGLLAAALLWQQYREQGRWLEGVQKEASGFLTVVEGYLKQIIQDYYTDFIVMMSA